MRNLKLLFIGLLMITALPLIAQTGGYGTHKFLTLPNSARVTALGGYCIASIDADLNNVVQNPALLNAKMNNRYAFNSCNYFGDISYGYLGTAFSLQEYGNFGIGIQYIDYGNFEMTNEFGDELGNFNAKENSLNFSYANSHKQFSYGATAKAVFSQLAEYDARAVLLDLGGTYADTINGFTASFVLKNIGSQTNSFTNENESMPFEALFGVSKKLAHAPFRFSLTFHDLQQFDLTYLDPNQRTTQIDLATGLPIAQKFSLTDKLMRHVALGTEIIFSENLQFRVGYNHQKRKELGLETRMSTVGFSWGFGMKISKIRFNYGSANNHLAGYTNMVSVIINPNDFKKKK